VLCLAAPSEMYCLIVVARADAGMLGGSKELEGLASLSFCNRGAVCEEERLAFRFLAFNQSAVLLCLP
jgi:hypothetical protein